MSPANFCGGGAALGVCGSKNESGPRGTVMCQPVMGSGGFGGLGKAGLGLLKAETNDWALFGLSPICASASRGVCSVHLISAEASAARDVLQDSVAFCVLA